MTKIYQNLLFNSISIIYNKGFRPFSTSLGFSIQPENQMFVKIKTPLVCWLWAVALKPRLTFCHVLKKFI